MVMVSLSERVRCLQFAPCGAGPVAYFMGRDRRSKDNWALLYAQEKALVRRVPLLVFFNLVSSFGNTSLRQYDFMIRGLIELDHALRAKNIPLILTVGDPRTNIAQAMATYQVGELVTDFSPLRFVRSWVEEIAQQSSVQVNEVDAHNIVPCWIASDKQEFAAYTFRPKIQKLYSRYAVPFPNLKRHPYSYTGQLPQPDWDSVRAQIAVRTDIAPVTWSMPGETAAHAALTTFLTTRLPQYADSRNDPNQTAQSDLSPYLHFGQLSAQRVALAVQAADHVEQKHKDAFLEELIVRKELSDNYCFYNEHYDSPAGWHDWAKQSHQVHRKDKREYIYTAEEFEQGQTHDPLWNAAQCELRERGKMHGFMRMYWAKKILEWTKTPEDAHRIALYLNDAYSLDGSDPNGYVGVSWSIGGLHDRAWFERPVFGKIRYMNYNGCKRKFDVERYIEQWTIVDTE